MTYQYQGFRNELNKQIWHGRLQVEKGTNRMSSKLKFATCWKKILEGV
jgi:hypothetical protein